MTKSPFSEEGSIAVLEETEESESKSHPTKPQSKSIIQRLKTKLSPKETVSANRYDIVLACQPDARDHYNLYDGIVNLVENKKKQRIYSPHNDIKRGKDLAETLLFTNKEAIPRTRGVIVHLTTITPEIQEMFESTYKNNRLFLLFYSLGIWPFKYQEARRIREHPAYRGEFVYADDDHAIRLLDFQIEKLIKTQ